MPAARRVLVLTKIASIARPLAGRFCFQLKELPTAAGSPTEDPSVEFDATPGAECDPVVRAGLTRTNPTHPGIVYAAVSAAILADPFAASVAEIGETGSDVSFAVRTNRRSTQPMKVSLHQDNSEQEEPSLPRECHLEDERER